MAEHNIKTLAVPAGERSIDIDRMASFTRSDLRDIIDDAPYPVMGSSSVGGADNAQATIFSNCESGNLSRGFCNEVMSETSYSRYLGLYGANEDVYYQCLKRADLPAFFLAPSMMPIPLSSKERRSSNPLAVFRVADAGVPAEDIIGVYPFSDNDVHSLEDYSRTQVNHSVNICDYYYVQRMLENKVWIDIDMAAGVLQEAHPEIDINNARLMLMYNMTHEAFATNAIDAWQDVEACRDVNCAIKDVLLGAFPGFADNASYFMWKSASIAMDSRLKQGYGPLQVIPEVVREAAKNKEISKRYLNYLDDSDLDSDDNIIRGLFVMRKAVYMRAMAIDNALSRLEGSVMKNKEVRHPSTNYPFISDPSASRQLAFIALAISLTNFPEEYSNAKNYLVHGPNTSALAMFYTIAEMYEVKPRLPGIELVKKHVDIVDFIINQDGVGRKMQGVMMEEPWEIRYVVPIGEIK